MASSSTSHPKLFSQPVILAESGVAEPSCTLSAQNQQLMQNKRERSENLNKVKLQKRQNLNYDESSQKADVLGGHITSSWFREAPGRQVPAKQNVSQRKKWPHVDEGVVIPLPSGEQLEDMQREFFQRSKGDGLGPASEQWQQQIFIWARVLKRRFFKNENQVTGLWAVASFHLCPCR